MIKQYFKQAWRILRENPILSFITILGTALSICMIMILVMVDTVKYDNLAPEVNRDRMLFINSIKVETTSEDGTSNNVNIGGVGMRLIKDIFLPLKTPQKVAFYRFKKASVKVPASSEVKSFLTVPMNADYWDCFKFSFIHGAPFTKDDVLSGNKKVVITEKSARKLYETDDVIGKTLILNDTEEFTICGVISDFTSLASYAMGDIWFPYTSSSLIKDDELRYTGLFFMIFLAKKPSDIKSIKREIKSAVAQFNSDTPNMTLDIGNQPDEYRVSKYRGFGFTEPDMKSINRRQLILYLLFLLVPAINISLLTNSRMRQRAHEIGLRRAYGASMTNILFQVIWESMLYTIIGAVLGLIFSLTAIYSFTEIVFQGYSLKSLDLSLWDFLQPSVLFYAILFCLLLNLLSSVFPAIRYAKKDIINSLEEE